MRAEDAVSSPADYGRTFIPVHNLPASPPVPTAAAKHLYDTLVDGLDLPLLYEHEWSKRQSHVVPLAATPDCIVGGLTLVQQAIVRFVLIEASNPRWPPP